MKTLHGKDVRDYDVKSQTCTSANNAKCVAPELFMAMSEALWGITIATISRTRC